MSGSAIWPKRLKLKQMSAEVGLAVIDASSAPFDRCTSVTLFCGSKKLANRGAGLDLGSQNLASDSLFLLAASRWFKGMEPATRVNSPKFYEEMMLRVPAKQP